jgi:hypothetical protein
MALTNSVPSLFVNEHDRFNAEMRDGMLHKLRRSVWMNDARGYRMLRPQHLRKLAEFESNQSPVISVYLELIPSTLSLDLGDPGVGAKRFDAAGLRGEASPSLAGGINDSLVVVMQPMREEALLEVEPHALDGIELRRIGRQGHERDVGRHAERARVMPAGLIKHHDDVLIVGDGGSEAVEELLHRLGVGIGHDEGEAVVGAGLNASKDVDAMGASGEEMASIGRFLTERWLHTVSSGER